MRVGSINGRGGARRGHPRQKGELRAQPPSSLPSRLRHCRSQRPAKTPPYPRVVDGGVDVTRHERSPASNGDGGQRARPGFGVRGTQGVVRQQGSGGELSHAETQNRSQWCVNLLARAAVEEGTGWKESVLRAGSGGWKKDGSRSCLKSLNQRMTSDDESHQPSPFIHTPPLSFHQRVIPLTHRLRERQQALFVSDDGPPLRWTGEHACFLSSLGLLSRYLLKITLSSLLPPSFKFPSPISLSLTPAI